MRSVFFLSRNGAVCCSLYEYLSVLMSVSISNNQIVRDTKPDAMTYLKMDRLGHYRPLSIDRSDDVARDCAIDDSGVD